MKQNSDAGHGKCLTSVREVEHGAVTVVVAGEGDGEQGDGGDVENPNVTDTDPEEVAGPAIGHIM